MKKKLLNMPFFKKNIFIALLLSLSIWNGALIPALAADGIKLPNDEILIDYDGTYTRLLGAMGNVYNDTPKIKVTPGQFKEVSNIKVFNEGKEFTFTDKVLNYNGTVYLPLRDFANLINAEVTWSKSNDCAILRLNAQQVGISNQNKYAAMNELTEHNGYVHASELYYIKDSQGKPIPSINYRDRLYIPMRFICETFGYNVEYTQANSITGTDTIEVFKDERPEIEPGVKFSRANSFRPLGADVGTEEEWKTFYNQLSPISNKTPIKGVYYQDGIEAFAPLFDHNGDGMLGGEVYTTDDNGKVIKEMRQVPIDKLWDLPSERRAAYQSIENMNLYIKNHSKPKPSYKGKTGGESSKDDFWVWSRDLQEWIPTYKIKTIGASMMAQVGTYVIHQEGTPEWSNTDFIDNWNDAGNVYNMKNIFHTEPKVLGEDS